MKKVVGVFWVSLIFIITLGTSCGWSHFEPHPNVLPKAFGKKTFQANTRLIGTGIAESANLGTIKSAPAGKALEHFHFVAFGDWGAGTPFQKAVASQLARQYAQNPFQVALLLGDNIYEVGDVKKHWKAYFTDMYQPLIQGGVHFLVALGNHDVLLGHQDEQLTFFKMPGYYYQDREKDVEFFVLNTNTFSKDAIQQQWLRHALEKSNAVWKIVMGHHPIYSSGEHGFNPHLQKTLEPILVQNHADFYLAGHDHDYERFKIIQGVQHIVSGGGGAYLRDFKKPMQNSLIRLKKHHFLSFEQVGNRLDLSVYDSEGNLIDQARWTKPALQKNERTVPQVKSLPGQKFHRS